MNYGVHKSEKIELNYWVCGYRKNIESGKWQIENGIPLGLYTRQLNAPLAQRVHISGLCEYCFALIERNEVDKTDRVVDFLSTNLVRDYIEQDNIPYAYWKTYHDKSLENYYVHGMGQGQLLSLLTRMYLYGGQTELHTLILEVSNSYLVDFQHKNGFVIDEKEVVFLEEYPRSQNLMKHVLNGWIYSALGLSDYISYMEITGYEDKFLNDKKRILKCTIATLETKLPEYNLGFWSLYNLPKSYKNICSIHYQEQHVVLLHALFLVSGNSVFEEYSTKFKAQYRNIFFRFYSLVIKVFIANILKYKRIYKK